MLLPIPAHTHQACLLFSFHRVHSAEGDFATV